MHVIPERNEMERGNLNIIKIASLTLLAMTYCDMVLSKSVNSYNEVIDRK